MLPGARASISFSHRPAADVASRRADHSPVRNGDLMRQPSWSARSPSSARTRSQAAAHCKPEIPTAAPATCNSHRSFWIECP
eukprot:5516929-Pyramimonas_sp.AAC.1